MKLKKVLSICKTNGLYYLYDRIDRSGEITQWLGDGYTIYPLDGLPILDEESFCAVFDIRAGRLGLQQSAGKRAGPNLPGVRPAVVLHYAACYLGGGHNALFDLGV